MTNKKGTKKAAKKRLSLYRISLKVFMVTGLIYFGTSVGLRAMNEDLNLAAQEYNNDVVTLQKDNEGIRMQINQLSTYDRVVSIASQEGMDVAEIIYSVVNE